MTASTLLSVLLALQGQRIPTRPSTFLVSNGSVYLPSPTYAVKTACPDERWKVSSDGTRLAYVSEWSTETPAAMERRVTRRTNEKITTRLGVWNLATGRCHDLFLTDEKARGIGDFAFMGSDVVFSTFGSDDEHRLWLARDGGTPQPINVPSFKSGRFTASAKVPALVFEDGERLWLLSPTRTMEIPLPKGTRPFTRRITANDRAIVMLTGDELSYLLINFRTGSAIPVKEPPVPSQALESHPFILDIYANHPSKETPGIGTYTGADAEKLDGIPASVAEEDGGLRLNIVERTGPSRRRIAFAQDLARTLEVSDDGLTFAFVSNGLLMVRRLIRADAETSRRFLATSD